MVSRSQISFPSALRFTSRFINQVANFWAPQQAFFEINLYNLPKNTQRALILYTPAAISYFLNKRLDQFNNFSYHSMYWETTEMINLLNKSGYIVDYVDHLNPPKINWQKYDLVIENWCHLMNAPKIAGQTRVYYATSCHWLYQNQAELSRISQFANRNNFFVPAERQLPFNTSDSIDGFMTYFGNAHQLSSGYAKTTKKIPLNISSVYVPPSLPPKNKTASTHFIWMGGGGLVHKGLDLAVEAFSKIPHATLHVIGGYSSEALFADWLKKQTKKYDNIVLHGYLNVTSVTFAKIASQAVGVVYPSCAEGGPGSVAQLLHFGLIPIVTKSANVRAERLGYVTENQQDKQIIDFIIKNVEKVMAMSQPKLVATSMEIKEYARVNHTRQSYSQSFQHLLEIINK
ncbi:MAG: glycosyltransferase [Patescibacteria group bacterium]|nr:glycosyltransferase [Patescibacteria group bacterium]